MQEIENERLIRKQACPMSASVHWDPKDDTQNDDLGWLEIYNKLPYQIRLGLVVEKTEENIIRIAKKFNIYKISEVGEISRIIRDSFVEGVFNEEKIKKRIVERIRIDENEAEKLIVELFSLRKKISDIENSGLDIEIERMPLISALKKFPEIGKQLLGESKIKISEEIEPRKQSIENWLDDYTIQKGSQAHNNLERSDYIFNSKNVSNLTFLEKKALLMILESYDENSDLEIDANRKIILFNNTAGEISEKLKESLENKKQQETEEFIEREIREVQEKEIPSTEDQEKKVYDEKTEEMGKLKETESEKQKTTEEEGEIQSKHLINLKDV